MIGLVDGTDPHCNNTESEGVLAQLISFVGLNAWKQSQFAGPHASLSDFLRVPSHN